MWYSFVSDKLCLSPSLISVIQDEHGRCQQNLLLLFYALCIHIFSLQYSAWVFCCGFVFLFFFFNFWHTYKIQNPTFFALSDKELYARGLKLMVITHALYMIFSSVGLGSAYEIFIFLCAIVLDLSIQFLKMFLSCSVPADFVVFPIQGPNQDPTEICVGHWMITAEPDLKNGGNLKTCINTDDNCIHLLK